MGNCRNSAPTLELVRASSVITLLPQLSLKQIISDPNFTLMPIVLCCCVESLLRFPRELVVDPRLQL